MSAQVTGEVNMSTTKQQYEYTKSLEDEASDDDSIASEENSDEDAIISLPAGLSKGYHIVAHATVPSNGFSMDQLVEKLVEDEIKRLDLTPRNVTVPVALMMLFPEEFGSLTRARKECRRNKIIVLRRLVDNDGAGADEGAVFDPARMIIGKVGDRV